MLPGCGDGCSSGEPTAWLSETGVAREFWARQGETQIQMTKLRDQTATLNRRGMNELTLTRRVVGIQMTKVIIFSRAPTAKSSLYARFQPVPQNRQRLNLAWRLEALMPKMQPNMLHRAIVFERIWEESQ
jgi:hypothetical protein